MQENSQQIEVCRVKVSDLKEGMTILNVGIVKHVDEYSNMVVVSIVSGDIHNALHQVNYSPSKRVYVDSVDGKPTINDRYF